MRFFVLAALVVGCGRVGFESTPEEDGAGGFGSTPDADVVGGDGSEASPRSVTVSSGTGYLSGVSLEVTLDDAVDPARAFLLFGASNDGADPDGAAAEVQLSGQLVGPTTLRFERALDPGSIATIKWYVVELGSGSRVLRGRRNVQNLTSVDEILDQPVDPSRAFPIISFRTTGGTYDGGDYLRARITSPTTLQIARSEGENQLSSVEWQVVEIEGARVLSGVASLGGGQPSVSATMASVDPSRTLVLFTYSRGVGYTGLMGLRGRLVDATTLVFDRDAAADPLSIAWYANELQEGARVNRGTASVSSSQTVANVDVGAVDASRAIALGGAVYYRGGKTPSMIDIRGVNSFTFDLRSASELRLQRFVAGAPIDLAWQVIEFPP